MDKTAVCQIDPDVIDSSLSAGGEKHQIARLQFVSRDRLTAAEKFGTCSGQARGYALHAIAHKA
jgi:hypothetical protein